MLTLQHYGKTGWATVGAPYDVSYASKAQQAATMLSHATGVVWRVLGSDANVLVLWDGRRWQRAAETTTATTSWWDQMAEGWLDTIPVEKPRRVR